MLLIRKTKDKVALDVVREVRKGVNEYFCALCKVMDIRETLEDVYLGGVNVSPS